MAQSPFRRPYAPSSRMADLVLMQGQQQAQAEREAGDRSAYLWSNLGTQIARTAADVVQAREQEPIRRMQRENAELENAARKEEARRKRVEGTAVGTALKRGEDGVFRFDRDYLTEQFTAGGIADRIPEVFAGLNAYETGAANRRKQDTNDLAGLSYAVLESGADPQAFGLAMDSAVKNRYLSKEEAIPLMKAVHDDPSRAPAILKELILRDEEWGQRWEKRQTDGGFSLSPGQTRYNNKNEPIATASKVEEPPKAGTPDDWLRTKAKETGTPWEMVTSAQKAKWLKEYNALNDDPYLAEMRQMRAELMRRQGNSPDMSPAQFNIANRLADDFARDSKEFVQRGQSYSTVLAATKDHTPASDLSLIFAYMKMLDPGSVVREGEFATAQNTAGVPDRIRNAYNKAIEGTRLSPDQRKDFVSQAKNIFDESKRRQTKLMETYKGRAKVANVPDSLVVMDYGAGIEPEEPKTNTTTGFTVTLPDGRIATLPTQKAADDLKKKLGIQ